jgi:hypothetical protein
MEPLRQQWDEIARLVDVAGNVQLNVLEQVNPAQFLGIEINPRTAAIAELVVWIGYLQWYFKRYGNAAPPESVLQAFSISQVRQRKVIDYHLNQENPLKLIFAISDRPWESEGA